MTIVIGTKIWWELCKLSLFNHWLSDYVSLLSYKSFMNLGCYELEGEV